MIKTRAFNTGSWYQIILCGDRHPCIIVDPCPIEDIKITCEISDIHLLLSVECIFACLNISLSARCLEVQSIPFGLIVINTDWIPRPFGLICQCQ